jgi:dihydropteroate synthase
MAEEGADVIDVGGESTRPGASPVDSAEELRRVLPVIERTRGLLPISIDTTKAAVAARAIEAGAVLVNDVSGATADPAMLSVVAERGAAIILMHRKGTPQTMDRLARYRDVVGEVKAFLSARIETARRRISRDRIAVDPGQRQNDAKSHARPHRRSWRYRCRGVSTRFLGRLLKHSTEERLGGQAASLLAGGRPVRSRSRRRADGARARVAQAIWALPARDRQ